MRRLMPLVIAMLLALTGCTHTATMALPTSSPWGQAPEGEDTPPASPEPSASAPSPISCAAAPTVSVNRVQFTATGPQGSRQSTGSATVALTFDDGPDPVNTPRILDLLAQCGVKATFCVVGYKVAMFPDVIRRIVAEGHTLCNHTWKHIMQLGTYGPALIRADLQRTNDAIHAIVPDAKVSYFRAPGGFWTADYVTVAHQLGMTPIDWAVDPKDWDFSKYGTGQAMTTHIISAIEANARPGSIVLSHDFQKPATTAAYRVLLPWLTARFQLIALPSVLPTPPAGGGTL